MKEGDSLPTVERSITQERIDRYATASGDFNPVHVDHRFAATSRFGRTIAHGMLVAATISEMLTAVFSINWLESGNLKLRFKNPVYPGDTVVALGKIERISEQDGVKHVVCSVSVQRQSGEEAIKGDASIIIPDLVN